MSTLVTQPGRVKVWDPLVRIFHWSLVFFFFLAYLTEDANISLHVWAGYTVALLIGFRLLWGVIGTKYACFSQFIKSPREIVSYIKKMLGFKAPHYAGHNPAAVAMIFCLLICLVAVSLSGMTIIAAEGQGPLAGTFFAQFNASWMEEIHEFFVNATLFLVFFHLAGVIFSSFLEKQNLVKSMLNGFKKARIDYVDNK